MLSPDAQRPSPSQAFPEFGALQPRSYLRVQQQLEREAEARPTLSWTELRAALAAVAAPSPEPQLCVGASSKPSWLAGSEAKPHRVYSFDVAMDGVHVHTFCARYSQAKRWHEGLQKAGALPRRGAAPRFPPDPLLRDMTRDEANVAQRGAQLAAYFGAVLAAGALAHEQFSEVLEDPSFHAAALRSTYARTFDSLRRDTGLLQRAMAFLRATGEVPRALLPRARAWHGARRRAPAHSQRVAFDCRKPCVSKNVCGARRCSTSRRPRFVRFGGWRKTDVCRALGRGGGLRCAPARLVLCPRARQC